MAQAYTVSSYSIDGEYRRMPVDIWENKKTGVNLPVFLNFSEFKIVSVLIVVVDGILFVEGIDGENFF